MVETKGGKRMKIEAPANYDNLWNRVLVLNYSHSRALLCFLMGYCYKDEHFLKGVEDGLIMEEEAAAKEG